MTPFFETIGSYDMGSFDNEFYFCVISERVCLFLTPSSSSDVDGMFVKNSLK